MSIGRGAMTTIAREIDIEAVSGTNIDDAVVAGIARASRRLGRARCARIRETRVDASLDHVSTNRVRLLVSFVLDD
jgi:flavin-binding protein dodecin